MKKKFCIILISILYYCQLNAQIGGILSEDRTKEVLSITATKIKVLSKNDRVIERTFADMLFPKDTSNYENRFLTHYFSTSRNYHLNVFASSKDVNSINMAIMKKDANEKIKVVKSSNLYSNDVNISFQPTESGSYYVYITAKVKDKIESCFYNLIIDRE